MQQFWSRCKLGPARVYWVVGVLFEDEIIADGYTATIEEAEEQAGMVAGPEASQVQAYFAESRHRRKVHEARASRPAKSSEAEVRRYVYRADYSEYDGHRYVMAHPILKWTGRRAYVSENYCDVNASGDHKLVYSYGSDDRVFVLDRAVLESEGHAFSRSRRWSDLFYLRLEDALDPYGRRHTGPPQGVIEAIEVLGLTWPCTLRDVRTSYRRRSKETHPDAGGDAANFIVVKDAYDAALAGLLNWPGFDRAGT
jgi:hypothetical protein